MFFFSQFSFNSFLASNSKNDGGGKKAVLSLVSKRDAKKEKKPSKRNVSKFTSNATLLYKIFEKISSQFRAVYVAIIIRRYSAIFSRKIGDISGCE